MKLLYKEDGKAPVVIMDPVDALIPNWGHVRRIDDSIAAYYQAIFQNIGRCTRELEATTRNFFWRWLGRRSLDRWKRMIQGDLERQFRWSPMFLMECAECGHPEDAGAEVCMECLSENLRPILR
jgi:hypothetical protein